MGADETGFSQDNADGKNPQGKKAWLWVAVTPVITYFQVTLSRCTLAAIDLLGENFAGILISDRCGKERVLVHKVNKGMSSLPEF